MATVSAHYENLLAQHYTWMLGGDLEEAAAREKRLFESLGVASPGPRAIAVDLGCGPGPQTLALADIGFETVIGVDTSQELLDELEELARSRPAVRTVNGDLVEALPTVVGAQLVDLAVCMRDTLLHLPSSESVIALIDRVATSLNRGGTFVLTYRDLTQPLDGLDRFVPIRSDDERIMLCVLDVASPEAVTVSDLIYTRNADAWELHKSSYSKLRISPEWLRIELQRAGLNVTHHEHSPSGMWSTVASNSA